MAADEVLIEQFRIRIPGLDRHEAALLGEAVCELVAAGLPAGFAPVHLSALMVRLELPVGTPRYRLAEAIAAGVLERLR